jgi:outer membrane protein OmpA-like peptidoglycan-associated protein
MRTTTTLALAACLAVLLLPSSHASAQQVGYALHIEPGMGIWVDNPQADRFKPGFYGAVRPSLTIGRILSLQLSYAGLFTPNRSPFSDNGVVHFFMAGARIRPFASIMPSGRVGGFFADVNLGLARTGDLSRFAFDIGLGYGWEVAPSFSIGPYLRYVQVVQGNDTYGEDPNDGQMLVVGVDIAFGPGGHRSSQEHDCMTAGECECTGTHTEHTTHTGAVECVPVDDSCADADRDGVCNEDDECPTQVGVSSTLGCPIDPCTGRPLMVLVQFSFDSSQMPVVQPEGEQTMDPVLEAVAAAVLRDESCRVCIIGYASEEGDADHNMTLSSQRASAVQRYMTARGLQESRVPTAAMGDTCQIVPERSRERNRRVEFRRLQEGEVCPTTCAEQDRNMHPTQP